MQKTLSGKAVKSSRADRAPRACVRCRHQKIRCDGFSNSGGDCSSCKLAQVPCQYIDTTTSLDRQRKRYIQKLEERVEQLESLLRRLHPGEYFPELGDPISYPTANPLVAKTTVYPIESLVNDFESIQLENEQRVYGKFSNSGFPKIILEKMLREKGATFEDFKELRSRQIAPGSPDPGWMKMPLWQRNLLSSTRAHRLSFPPEDLMTSLIGHYFAHEHLTRPILHRPTFEAMVQARLHEKDQYFGGLVLMVCACGSRWSNDPRTRTRDDMPNSAGWLYYEQVHRLPRPMNEPVSLVRLQLINLMLVFLGGTFLVSLQWSLIGIGLRLALDVGAHLNSSFASAPVADRELWKRAFWSLFVANQLTSAGLGRSAGVIPNGEIDLDLPLEVDDEYWYPQDPSQAFIQPAGKPSTISGFNSLIQLMYLMPKVTQITKGPGESPEEYETEAIELVAELDSSLNQWLGNLPPHLQWKPSDQNLVYFAQSAMLHTLFHQYTITIHRPFIPQMELSDNVQLDRATSFAICKNAARSLSRVVQTFATRASASSGEPWMFLGGFNAMMILLLDYCDGGGTKKEDIERCIDSVIACEGKYAIASAMREVLQCLVILADEFSARSTRTDSTGTVEICTTTPSVTSTSSGPLASPDDPPTVAHLGLTSNLDLAGPSSFAFLPTGNPMEQLFTAEVLPPAPPALMECETALLQDWSHQPDTSDWFLWDFLLHAPEAES